MERAGRRRGVLTATARDAVSVALLGLGTLLAVTPSNTYIAPGSRAVVHGRALNFYCIGQGAPVVVLEAGLGGRASQWVAVQNALTSDTTVCSYDRAGYGFSDAGSMPRTSQAIANELFAALQALDISGPYVLVATSYGTFDVRLFAHDHPRAVAGAVLVNPSAEQEELGRADPAIAKIDRDGLNDAKQCMAAAAAGELTADASLQARCIGPADDSAAGKMRRDLLEGPKTWRALVSEWSNIGISARQVANAHQRFGTLPLVVISVGIEPSYAAESLATRTAMRAFWPKLNAWQNELAALSSDACHLRTRSADRRTERSDPKLVATSVRALLEAVRYGKPLRAACPTP